MAALRPFFFEAPTETVGRRPCSHGGGPLRELDGQCPPSPIAGSPVPCSAPSGALRRNIKRYAGTHRPPAHRLPPSATGPREGGPLATDRRCSGASACRFASPLRRGPRPPAPLASGYRRLCPPVAPPPSRPPARLATPFGRLGRLRHSVLRLALGLLRVGLRPTLRATAGSPPALLRRCLGGSPQDGPVRVLPSLVPRSVGRLGGLRAPLLPPGAWSGPCGPLSQATGPGRSWEKTNAAER